MQIQDYQIKQYLNSKYKDMHKTHLDRVKYNAIRNAVIDLNLVSESKMEKWEYEFKKEVEKCLEIGKEL